MINFKLVKIQFHSCILCNCLVYQLFTLYTAILVLSSIIFVNCLLYTLLYYLLPFLSHPRNTPKYHLFVTHKLGLRGAPLQKLIVKRAPRIKTVSSHSHCMYKIRKFNKELTQKSNLVYTFKITTLLTVKLYISDIIHCIIYKYFVICVIDIV